MKRRQFITLLGGAAAWPLAARAQQSAMQVIGLLIGQLTGANYLAAFRQGLAEGGFIEGRNLAIVYRSAEGDSAKLPALAAELVALPVAVIAAVGGGEAVLSAKAATASIPIVFTTASDPVETGFVTSLSRPGGNVTGTSFVANALAPKQVGLLRDMVPGLATIGLLLNKAQLVSTSVARDVQAAVLAVGLQVVAMEASTEQDIDAAFTQFKEQRIGALVISSAAFFNRHQDRLVALAARHAIPAIFNNRDYPVHGGLMSYGADIADSYRQVGVYVSRILKGEKPANLPVIQPTKFELLINLKTAKALGLTVPPNLLAIADEVIE
jgi:putative ABC transport system substrate-binding protein